MGVNKYSGMKTIVYSAARGTIKSSGALTANQWEEIVTAGAAPAIPFTTAGAIFKTPDTSQTPITLASGDSVYPLTLTRICKADADFSAEVGTIDVTDDCDDGYGSMILDGITTLSGNLSGFSRYDDTTGALETSTASLFNKFIDKATDDGAGVYTQTNATNEKFYLFILLNKDAAATQVQNWLIVPVYLSSLGAGAGLKDAQKRDLSWVKAPGPAVLYQRTAYAADVIT
jgi:hypothetical protein